MVHEKQTILITGGSGFVGRNLTDYFKDRYYLLTPSHEDLNLLSSTGVSDYFSRENIDYVIHCANVGGTRKSSQVSDVFGQNVRMFTNLMENSRRYEKMIYFGSGAEYNKYRDLMKVTEGQMGVSIPPDDYGFSKYIMNKLTMNAGDITNLRLFGVFGKYEDYEYKFISNAIVKNLLLEPITIVANKYFDYVYIDDVMKIVDHFLTCNSSTYTDYNITPSIRTDLLNIAEIILAQTNLHDKIYVHQTGVSELNYEYTGSNARLLEELGTFEFTPFEKSIHDLTDYYRSIITKIDHSVIKKDVYAKKIEFNRYLTV